MAGNAIKRHAKWAAQRGVKLAFIEPGRPIQNAFMESFNGRFQDERMNTDLGAYAVRKKSSPRGANVTTRIDRIVHSAACRRRYTQ